jgi:hypothetical protein
LTYCLLKRLIAGQPTIFSTEPEKRFLFHETGVYSIPHNSFSQCDNIELQRRHPDALALVDFNDNQLTVADFLYFRTVVASSPKLHRYKEWMKQKNVQTYVMKTWAWPEVYHAR